VSEDEANHWSLNMANVTDRQKCGSGKNSGIVGNTSGGKSGNQKRTTQIVRTYAGDHWVDMEVLCTADFGGNQWPGPDQGNHGQENQQTIKCDPRNIANPDIAVVNFPSGKDDPHKYTVKTKQKRCAKMKSRNDIERRFNNKQGKGNGCRNNPDGKGGQGNQGNGGQGDKEGCKKRIAFNYIDKSLLLFGDPPSDPKKYREAVKKTNDQVDFWLNIEIPKSTMISRNRGYNGQDVQYDYFWECSKINLPGSDDKIDLKAETMRTDPYQVPINFGPDFLAVRFSGGAS
jgi:hypothetical protein